MLLKNILICEYIKHEGDKWVVYSHQTGKNFGEYKTQEEAEARLSQMHKFSKKKGMMSPDYAPSPAIGNSNALFGQPLRRSYPDA